MVPAYVLRNVYYALIYIRFTYAFCAWGSDYPIALKRLYPLVEKAISIQTIHPKIPVRYFLQNDGFYKSFILCSFLNYM